ncbi:MAG: DNA repair protein RecO [Candidatus Falkowbacteria bacterium]
MAESDSSEAIIINRNDWRENDSRVVLYTKNFGKLSLVARGAKKMRSKIAGHIEPISLADVMILRGRAYDYLGSAITRRAYLNIKADLNALYFVGAALALFDKLVKEAASDEELFNFLISWLDTVESNLEAELDKENGELLYNYFSLRLLAILGYKPELYHCLECRRKIEPGANYFNLRLGGLICPTCLVSCQNKYLPNELIPVSDNCVKLLRIFSESDRYQIIKTNSVLIRELSRLTKAFVDFN